MRIKILQHSKDSPPGTLLEWLKMKNREADIVKLYEGEPLPSLEQTDWLIILGGGMNLDETDKHPWLAEEKQLLKKAIESHKTCLGICLGSQLLAQTLGAQVKPHAHWEVGWHPIHLGSSPDGGTRMTVFHYHQDTFDIPEGAVRVANNRITENQGFAYGDHVLGLQFHPEATPEWIKSLSEPIEDYPTGPHVQTPEQVEEGMIFMTPMKKWFFDLLDRMESVTATGLKKRAQV